VEKQLKNIADSLGWIALFLFFISVNTCGDTVVRLNDTPKCVKSGEKV